MAQQTCFGHRRSASFRVCFAALRIALVPKAVLWRTARWVCLHVGPRHPSRRKCVRSILDEGDFAFCDGRVPLFDQRKLAEESASIHLDGGGNLKPSGSSFPRCLSLGNQMPHGEDDLVPVKGNKSVRPRPATATSVPGMLPGLSAICFAPRLDAQGKSHERI